MRCIALKKSKRFLLFSSTCCLILLSCVLTSVLAFGSPDSHYNIHVPTIDEVLKNGYPINANGETYGKSYGNSVLESPDLELAENEQGVIGYVRMSETDGVDSPEDVVNYKACGHYVNMYLEDGVTVIGKFYVSGNEN